MQKKEIKKNLGAFAPRRLAVMALMIALSIVLGKYLAINVTVMIRISLENLPIILTAVILGPLSAGIVAMAADILGCVLVGYEINPIVTFGAIIIGVLCGSIFKYFKLVKQTKRLILSVLASHFCGSVVIKTLGLAAFYLASYDMGFGTLFFIRLFTYAVTSTIEILIISFLLKNKTLKGIFERL